MEQKNLDKGAKSPETARLATVARRVEALEINQVIADARDIKMQRQLSEAYVLIAPLLAEIEAFLRKKTEESACVERLYRLLTDFSKAVGRLESARKVGVEMRNELSEGIRNVNELKRLCTDIVEELMDKRNNLSKKEEALDARGASASRHEGNEPPSPHSRSKDMSLLRDEEVPLFNWIGDEERTRRYIEQIKKLHTKTEMIHLIKKMFHAEEGVTAEVVMDIHFYYALRRFVPEDNVKFRDRKRVWESLVNMLYREKKKLQEKEKRAHPEEPRRKQEALIEHAKERERARVALEKDQKERKKRKRRRRR
ncbi:MAG: hypothetical protein LUB83_03040 [Prevotellaceae bacterium]|nr:hypothetical protein [Prevotellaceae bacterium]